MPKLRFYSIWDDIHMHGTMYRLLQRYDLEPVDSPEEADILVFNGGADIGTSIYNEDPVFRGIPYNRSPRDNHEIDLYDRFVGSKFMLGICRGAQLLNCMNGGSLWQHVTEHQRDHEMVDLTTGEIVWVTSTHHQMMIPNLSLGQVIGVANICKSRENGAKREIMTQSKEIKDGKDIEVVWYPKSRCLCIQGHPEYVPGTRFSDWSVDLLNKKYNETRSILVA